MSFGLRSATVRFGDIVALEDVSVDVRAGSVVALVGGDGAGKTTLLRALVREVRVSHGSVHAPDKEHIGYLPASAGSWAALTVAQNIDFAGGSGLHGSQLATRQAELLKAADLTAASGRLASQLSGGMRRKLGFCMAMVHRPALSLDEPSTGVDPVSRIDLWRLISEAAADGAAVVMSTTYLDEAERAAQLLVMDAGRVLAEGDYDQVRADFAGTVTQGEPVRHEWSWRRGHSRHEYWLNAEPPPELTIVEPDLEDIVIALSLARAATTTGGRGRGDMTTLLASAEGVTRRFGSFTAVDDVSMHIDPGEVVGLLGANGAGKTTLIRMLLGVLATSDGRVQILGGPPDRAHRRRLGYVPQNLGLYRDLTVSENLSFITGSYGVAVPDLPENIAVYRDVLVGAMPLGAQRQVAFTASLAHRPELLLLDEPTSGVDALSRARLWDIIRAESDSGVGILVSTHYMQEAQECDRLLLMSSGRLVAQGSEADIIGDTTAVVVRTNDWATAFTALNAAGAAVILDGRTVRVANADPAEIQQLLHCAGINDIVEPAPATIEERMLVLAGS